MMLLSPIIQEPAIDLVPYLPFAQTLIPIVLLLGLWTLVIKGFALWHAGRNTHKIWFIAFLVVNTLGILEVIYLLWLRSRKPATIAGSNTPPGTSI